MADIYRQRATTSPPSLTDLIAVYPLAGLSPGAADNDAAAITRANMNPPQITTLQALATAVRPEQATTEQAGVVELATVQEARDGFDSQRAVTPAGLRAAIGVGGIGGGAGSFTALNDTPSTLGGVGQYIRVNASGNLLEFVNQPLPTGAQIVDALTALSTTARLPATAVRDLPAGNLVGLTDTPSSIGNQGQVLVVNNTRTGFEWADQSSPESGLSRVISDGSLSGQGTSSSPLSVANPFTAADKTKLDGIETGADANVRADWNATSGDGLILNKPDIPNAPTGGSVRDLLITLSGNERLPATAVRDLPSGGGGSSGIGDNLLSRFLPSSTGRYTISSSTYTNLGSIGIRMVDSRFYAVVLGRADMSGSPLGGGSFLSPVTHVVYMSNGNGDLSFGFADITFELEFRTPTTGNTFIWGQASSNLVSLSFQILGIFEFGGVSTTETGASIVSKLEGLSGNARLDASAIKNLPQPQSGGLDSVETDSTLSGLGTQADPLSIVNPFTAADETKLDGIESNATADQSASEIRDALVGLTGAARLPATAIRDLPAGNFLGLTDTPNTFGTAGQYLAVNSETNALEFIDAPSVGGVEFSLGDNLLPSSVNVPNTNTWTSLGVKLESGRIYQIQVERTAFRDSFNESLVVRITDAELNIDGVHGLASGRLSFRNSNASFTEARVPSGAIAFTVLAVHKFEAEGSAGGGSSTFIGLTDTPNDYADATAGQILALNSGKTALEFIDAPSGGGGSSSSGIGDNLLVSNYNTGSITTTLASLSPLPIRLENGKFYVVVLSGSGIQQNPIIFQMSESTTIDFYSATTTALRLATIDFRNSSTGNTQVWGRVESGILTGITFAGIYEFAGATDSATTFAALTDTPNDYADATAGQILALNSGKTALEFIDATGGGGGSGIGDNLLSNFLPTQTTYYRIRGSRNRTFTELGSTGIRMENGRFYAVVLGGSSGGVPLGTALIDNPLTFIVYMTNGNGDFTYALGDLTTAGNDTISYEFRTPDTGNTTVWARTTAAANVTIQDQILGIFEFGRGSSSGGGSSTFLGLTDTPTSFGTAGQYLAVNSDTNALEFIDATSAETGASIVSKLTGLSGNARLPATAVRDLPSGGGGSSTFTGLTDTPASLGTAGQIPAVNSGGTALEFIDAPSGGSIVGPELLSQIYTTTSTTDGVSIGITMENSTWYIATIGDVNPESTTNPYIPGQTGQPDFGGYNATRDRLQSVIFLSSRSGNPTNLSYYAGVLGLSFSSTNGATTMIARGSARATIASLRKLSF